MHSEKFTWLILDVSNLAWRNFFALSGWGDAIAMRRILFGLLRDIVKLSERFQTAHFVFAFDSEVSNRRSIYPMYKMNRDLAGDLCKEEGKKNVLGLIDDFRLRILPDLLKFKNTFCWAGFEADDLIASICNALPESEGAVIVSSDSDLFQLLRPGVCIYRPTQKELLTHEKFADEYGIVPSDWAKVKAMAGCKTDNIDGLPGIGECTAIKLIKNEMSSKSKAYKALQASGFIVARNYELVRLPLKGTPTAWRLFSDDGPNAAQWNRTMDYYDFHGLLGKCPTKSGVTTNGQRPSI